MASEVEYLTIDCMIKGHHVYKDVWLSLKCCTVAMIKEVDKGLSGRHPATEKTSRNVHSLKYL